MLCKFCNENEVVPPRRLYCSDKCARAAQRQCCIDRDSAMTLEAYTMDVSQRKSRTCLRCSKSFMSYGPGNRICPQCGKYEIQHGHVRRMPCGTCRSLNAPDTF